MKFVITETVRFAQLLERLESQISPAAKHTLKQMSDLITAEGADMAGLFRKLVLLDPEKEQWLRNLYDAEGFDTGEGF